MPTPINVPSQKKENKGRETFIPTPSSTSNEAQKVWGQGNSEQNLPSKSDNPSAPAPPVSNSPRPSPWNLPKPSSDSETAAPKQVSMPRWADAESDDEDELVPEVLSLLCIHYYHQRPSLLPLELAMPFLNPLAQEIPSSIVGVKSTECHRPPQRVGHGLISEATHELKGRAKYASLYDLSCSR